MPYSAMLSLVLIVYNVAREIEGGMVSDLNYHRSAADHLTLVCNSFGDAGIYSIRLISTMPCPFEFKGDLSLKTH
jgi:hypothetical protein